MKTILVVLFALVGLTSGYCQDLLLSAQAESTVAGMQAGATVMYETKKMWALGSFYQRSTSPSIEHQETNSFYGGQFQFPLVRAKRISFLGTVRAGFANNKFFVLAPGFETRINLGSRFAVGVGTSMRMNYPSVSLKLIVKIF